MYPELQKAHYKLPTLKDRRFINPLNIKIEENRYDKEFLVNPDPYVLKYNGEYYCYSTGDLGVKLLHSKDMIHWEAKGYVLQTPGYRGYWAPAVIYENGVFYMYYSSTSEENPEEHFEFLKVATATSPFGPFEYKKTLFHHFSIDAHVVKDHKGDFYLFYSVDHYMGLHEKRPGTSILVDKLMDMYTPAGHPKLVVKPTIDEEITAENRFGKGKHWHTMEGAFYLTHNQKDYLIYSGSDYRRVDYFLGYSVSSEAEGLSALTDKEWHKYPNDYTYAPILRKNHVVEGTGHNSVVKAPNNVDDWVVYHGRNMGKSFDEYTEQRQMRMDPMMWIGDKIWIPGPSFEEIDEPGRPLFQDLFDGNDGASLSQQWNVGSGQWRLYQGEVRQEDDSCIASALTNTAYEDYLFEANLRGNLGYYGGVFGIYACYADASNNLQILFDIGKRKLMTVPVINGIKGDVEAVELRKEFDLTSYHQFMVIKTGARVSVYLDNLFVAAVDIPFVKGKVGMVTYYTKAAFDGFAVTGYLKMDEDTAYEIQKKLHVMGDAYKDNECFWQVKEGTLYYMEEKITGGALLKGSVSDSYRFSVDVCSESPAQAGQYGVYAAFKGEGDYVKAYIDKQSHSACMEYYKNSTLEVKQEYKLPDGFRYDENHTFFVKRNHSRMMVLLDEYIVYDGNVDFSNATVGLISNTKVCFRNFELVLGA